jgi:Family of unknown function (DUF6298)
MIRLILLGLLFAGCNGKINLKKSILMTLVLVLGSLLVVAQKRPAAIPAAIKIDFADAGYKAGKEPIPQVPAVLLVRPTGSDDTRLLQAAIDHVGGLPVQPNGFRGALQLAAGRFHVAGQLRLQKSGVVIRGQAGRSQSILVAAGNDRRTLIVIGHDPPPAPVKTIPVTDQQVPAGSRRLTLEHTRGMGPGTRVVITRPSTANWIADIGMNKAEGMFVDRRGLIWTAGSRNLVWDRVITGVDAAQNQVTLDAPLTTALERQYGGGTLQVAAEKDLVHSIGLEGLTLESAFTSLYDEEHAWMGVAIHQAEDVWVRDVTARYFVSSAVRVEQRARRVTIANCSSEQPVSEVGGYRRHSFYVEGQQVLVQKCRADAGVNAFASGFCAGGPNVFFDCTATNALGASGSFESWASGVLYEKVKIQGAGLRLTYDFDRAQAGGWTAANSVIWNCEARGIEALGPPEAPNLVVRAKISLYQTQRQNKWGKAVASGQQASNGHAKEVPAKVREFTLQDFPVTEPVIRPAPQPLQIVNGRFVINGKLLWGGTLSDQFWKGQTSPANALELGGTSISRYVPGKVGPGLTEDLPRLAQNMVSQGNPFYQSFPGLWYDRRRDDHAIEKRPNAQVWAPFFEMPWLRSGQGQAQDGLSRYDLTRYNPWYFQRMRDFARLCDEQGLVLYYNLHDTHNLLEYLTHWVDYPWRPVNTVTETGLPEPPPVEPWDRLHIANQYYDAANPHLQKLHRAYIFHTLDQLGSFQNVIFTVGIQFTGPLAFQRFFLQTVAEWEKQNNRNVRIAIETSKDITDAILSDPALAPQVDVINTRYWQYRPDGTLWAPPGGTNRAFREMVGEAFILQNSIPFPTTSGQMYRQVREYRDRFPDKAILTDYNDIGPIPSLMAGGALVLLRNQINERKDRMTFYAFVQKYLSDILMRMDPQDQLLENNKQNWCLADDNNNSLLIYSLSGTAITWSKDLAKRGYSGVWFDPLTERTLPLEGIKMIRKGTVIQKPSKTNWLLLLQATKKFRNKRKKPLSIN